MEGDVSCGSGRVTWVSDVSRTQTCIPWIEGEAGSLGRKTLPHPRKYRQIPPSSSSRELQVLIRHVVHQGKDNNIQTF